MQDEVTFNNMCKASAVMKLVCGVGNNAAWLVMLDGYDHARRHYRYGFAVKKAFADAIKSFHTYESSLVYATKNRLFHLEDMNESIRRKYGNISDREYYDFWASAGSVAYQKTQPQIRSLQNKYMKSLASKNVRDAEHTAWVMTATAALNLSCQMYRKAADECVSGYGLRRTLVERVFGGLSLSDVEKRWHRAMDLLEPCTYNVDLEDAETRDIQYGLEGLLEAWASPSLLYDCVLENVEDFGEIFSSKGSKNKTLRELALVRNETLEELRKRM